MSPPSGWIPAVLVTLHLIHVSIVTVSMLLCPCQLKAELLAWLHFVDFIYSSFIDCHPHIFFPSTDQLFDIFWMIWRILNDLPYLCLHIWALCCSQSSCKQQQCWVSSLLSALFQPAECVHDSYDRCYTYYMAAVFKYMWLMLHKAVQRLAVSLLFQTPFNRPCLNVNCTQLCQTHSFFPLSEAFC